MNTKQLIFLVYICFRHGINPLMKNSKNREKYRKRLSDKEKRWVLNNCHENAKLYFTGLMYGK
jgi:hypothetical protein